MRAAIFNPYWDTLGGGERYTASLVSLLTSKNYSVDIEWSDRNILKQIKSRFDIDITRASIVESINRGDSYDFCFWLSDGSVPTLKARTNILHFQFPFQNTSQNILLNKMKFFRIKSVVCNSEFTKSFIDREYKINSEVIYPPIDIKKYKPGKKENLIIYVGRFSQLTQSKNQHVLVNVFKNLFDEGLKDWKLILAGGGEIGAEKYLKNLKVSAKGYPISILVSPNFDKLKELYSKAKIFWSAAGFDVDETKDPLKVEHFGMTLVEAMSAGVVPILPQKGGYKEIVKEEENGLFGSSEEDLLSMTRKLIKDNKLYRALSKNATDTTKKFSIEKFNESFSKYI